MSLTAIHVELLELQQDILGMLADCNSTKEPKAPPKCNRDNIPDGYWMDSSCKLHRITRITGQVQLGGLASNEPRVDISPGGATGEDVFKGKPPMRKPKNVDELTWQYQLAQWKCQADRVRQNQAYFRCRAQDGATAAGCKGLYVSVPCPDVERLRALITARDNAKPKANSPGFTGQGGQFGGGGASGSF